MICNDDKELEALEVIIHSDGWPYMKKIFIEREQYLVKDSHLALESHKDRIAGELLARSHEPRYLINKILRRVQDLRGGK